MFGKARSKPDPHGVAMPVLRPASGALAAAIPLGRLWWAAILLLGISVERGRLDDLAAQSRCDPRRHLGFGKHCGGLGRPTVAFAAVGRRRASGPQEPEQWPGYRRPSTFTPPSIQRDLSVADSIRDRLPQIFNIAIADETGQLWFRRGLAHSEHQYRRSRLLQRCARPSRWRPEHVHPDRQSDRRNPDDRLRATPGRPERQFHRDRVRQREFQIFRGHLRIDPIRAQSDIHPGPAGWNDPFSPSGRRRFRRPEALRGDGLARCRYQKASTAFASSGNRTARSGTYRSGRCRDIRFS